ncbi:MAG: hypothetical protein ACLP01_03230 [Solirubrobacteraceae bacterium]
MIADDDANKAKAARKQAAGNSSANWSTGAAVIGLVGVVGGVVGTAFGSPVVGGSIAVVLEGFSVAAAAHAASIQKAANADPPDRHWRSIVVPQPTTVYVVKAQGELTRSGAAALNRILAQMATVNGLVTAMVISTNRASSAKAAHSTVWFKRQSQAMGRFATEAGQAIDKLVTLLRASKALASVRFPAFTPALLKELAEKVRAHGLPAGVVRSARHNGLSAATIARIARQLASGVAPAGLASSLYGQLSAPALVNSELSAARALLTYGRYELAYARLL